MWEILKRNKKWTLLAAVCLLLLITASGILLFWNGLERNEPTEETGRADSDEKEEGFAEQTSDGGETPRGEKPAGGDEPEKEPEENIDPKRTGEKDSQPVKPTGGTKPGGTDPGETKPGGTDPGGTDPGGTDPGETDPGDTDPGGMDPGGTEPGGTDPGGTDPGETNPGGTDSGETDPGGTEIVVEPALAQEPGDWLDDHMAVSEVEKADGQMVLWFFNQSDIWETGEASSLTYTCYDVSGKVLLVEQALFGLVEPGEKGRCVMEYPKGTVRIDVTEFAPEYYSVVVR